MLAMKKIYTILILVTALFVLCTCDETILRDDCADLKEIELKLSAQYVTECEPGVNLPASGAAFKIISGADTLFTGNLDSEGRFDTGPIENSSCGLNNVVIEASFNGKTVRERFGVLCCDTLLIYNFQGVSCEEPIEINCQSIDSTIVKTITSSGECVLQNAQFNELTNNSVIIYSSKKVRFNVASLLSLEQPIYVEQLNPAPVENSVTIENGRLEIYFNVDRSVLGKAGPVVVNMVTECLDEQDNVQDQGIITIVIDAEICDPTDCYCPFSDIAGVKTYYANEPLMVGENRMFNFTIAELTSGNFSEGCILKIDKIERADGSDAYTRTNEQSWQIATTTFPDMKVGDQLAIQTNFAPSKPGKITEEFRVTASVYSENNLSQPQNAEPCTFQFKLLGEGCEMNCPLIMVLGNKVTLQESVSEVRTLIPGTRLDLGEGIINQKIDARMTTDCLQEMEEPGIAAFTLSLPDGYYCSDIRLQVDKQSMGTYDDRTHFTPILASNRLNNSMNTTSLGIYFNPPDMISHYNSGHGNTYECSFNLVVTDHEGNEICRQTIEISAEVYEFTLSSGDIIPMEAFSQVSASASQPSYHIYDIDDYNTMLGNYGLRQSLTRSFVNDSKVPHVPVSSHSLYFDVDSPDNPSANFTQKPELYLVNTLGNNFSKITALPVASFPTADAFFTAYESGNLMRAIFNHSDFRGTPDNFGWRVERDKNSFEWQSGIEIMPNEVYVIWDPAEVPDIYNFGLSKSRIYCGMALLYISSVKSGDDNTDPGWGGNGKATVSFYVKYPVKYQSNN
jgi:hypothetical protein